MVPHFDPECPMCCDLRDVIGDLDAIQRGPVACLRFRAYRRVLFDRLAMHATVRHSPDAAAVPMRDGEGAALDAEDKFTIRLVASIEAITKQFSAAVAAEVETTS